MPERTIAAAVALLLTFLALPSPASPAPETPRKFADLRQRAQASEARRDWLDACRWYDEILRKDRTQADVRASYLRCLRRHHISRRHTDSAYRQVINRLTPAQGLDVYEQVLISVARAYVDRSQTRWDALFHHGVEELRFALDEAPFVQEYFTGVAEDALKAFRDRLQGWQDKVTSRSDAREQVLAVLRAAQQEGLVLRPVTMTVVALEFACGACNALDEYTLFLTPGAMEDTGAVAGAGRPKGTGVGIEVSLTESRMEVTRVYPGGPAREAGVARRDRILRIDRQSVEGMTAEAMAERLRGEPGTLVELEVVSPGSMDSRVVRLARRATPAPSVEYDLHLAMNNSNMTDAVPVGVVRIYSFQENTLLEVKEALAKLRADRVKAVVLDLRGNPGGLFEVGVQVAELFLGKGVVVITESPFKKFNKPWPADIDNPETLPLVVLIDGDTASAAEVVAGALKEHRRATLVGQTTFGKGTIQCVIPLKGPPLDKMPGGIRITVARFLSPARQPYSGVGVSPDVPFTPEGDLVVSEAKRLLLGMLRPMVPMEPMGEPR